MERGAAKPWHTEEWREMRGRRIGDRCEQCDSTDGPFVLQHFTHDQPEPPSKYQIVWDLIREHGLYLKPPTKPKEGCPKCGRSNVYARKSKAPKWRCIKCNHEFDDPITVDVQLNNNTGGEEYARYLEARRKVFADFQVTHQDAVEERLGAALADYENERQASDDKYMSGEGTATFCKKCAFLWDVKGQMLCRSCRERYHAFSYETCFNCIPQRRKDEIEGYQKFAEEMDTVMERLEEEASR